MKLEPPLLDIINHCEISCVSRFCGIEAYDFSPICIACYFVRQRIEEDGNEMNALKMQLETLSVNYGKIGASGRGVEIEDMNQTFSGEKLDQMINELQININLAFELIVNSDKRRYKSS